MALYGAVAAQLVLGAFGAAHELAYAVIAASHVVRRDVRRQREAKQAGEFVRRGADFEAAHAMLPDDAASASADLVAASSVIDDASEGSGSTDRSWR